jgi:spore maturation protein CgeB
MKKILIVGPDFFGYNQSIERAFRNLRFETKVIGWAPGEVKTLKEKIGYYTQRNKEVFFDNVKEKFNQQVNELYQSFRPDLVFIIQGNYVLKSTVKDMPCQKVLWMMDSIYRAKGAYEIRNDVDHIFLFEKTDVEKLWQTDRIKSFFLPLALDESVYYPMNLERPIDILFVGTLYQKRIEMLERLVERFKNKNIQIYGRFYSPFRKTLFHLLRENKNIFLNKNISPSQVNEVYNRSKVCINIHHDQSSYGVNQRFFEIPGSGSFQLVENNPFVLDHFSEKEIMTYHSEEDLFRKIETGLKDPETALEMAQRAYKKVLESHTFTHRVKEMLQTIQL